MGIKDWFGGDKKKAAYREKLKEAVSKGKLDTQDLKDLRQLQEDLNVTPAAEDQTVMRREIYNEAVGAVRDKGQLSATGVHELAKIQKFLALRDDQVERTKWDLARLRTLTEIRQGILPTVSTSNVSLRGVQFEPYEVAHYSLQVDLLDQPSTRQNDGIRVQWNTPYAENSCQIHVLPEDGARAIGEGTLILTDKRLVLKTGNKTASVKFARDAQIYLYGDGIRLPRTVGNTLLRFRSRSGDTGEIVGELLAVLMRERDLSSDA